MPEKILGKEIKYTYRGKPAFKLMGKWMYFDNKGRGHHIKREYVKNIKKNE